MGGDSSLRIGTTLGKYKLVRVVGAGGMATVYEAKHRNGHRVALKVLRRALSVDADVRARFLREGYAANKVEHPGAVRIHDDDVMADGQAYLVMDLLEGSAVDTLAAATGRQLPLATVLAIGYQLCDVLAAAHDAGVIHRDVKPANVFVCASGELKVLDFGVARIVDPAAASSTATGRMLGTPAFMSPEQAYGRRDQIDAKSDLWSAGATVFTILTGRNVHDAASAEETLVKAATEPAPSVRTIAPDVPEIVARVVDRALARDKADRFEDARALRDALAEAHVEVFGRPVPERIEVDPASPAFVALAEGAPTLDARALPRGAVVLAGALVACCLAWVGWTFERPAQSAEEPVRSAAASTSSSPSTPPASSSEPVSEPSSPSAPLAMSTAAASAPSVMTTPSAPRVPPRVAAPSSSSARAPEPPAPAPSACFDYDEEGRKWPKRCP